MTLTNVPRIRDVETMVELLQQLGAEAEWTGPNDVRVHAREIATPEIDAALAKGKGGLIDFMTYPGEFHYFTREHVLRDAWQRVDRFFAKHLKGVTAATN